LPHFADPAGVDTDTIKQCFRAGDSRVNNNLALTSMHTLFMREHVKNFAKAFDLVPLKNGTYYSGYNPNVNFFLILFCLIEISILNLIFNV
jgi:hypothetical protein